jgi:hypothetical protein
MNKFIPRFRFRSPCLVGLPFSSTLPLSLSLSSRARFYLELYHSADDGSTFPDPRSQTPLPIPRKVPRERKALTARFAARRYRMIRYINPAYDCSLLIAFEISVEWHRGEGDEDGVERDRVRRGGRIRINQSDVLSTQRFNPPNARENAPLRRPLSLSTDGALPSPSIESDRRLGGPRCVRHLSPAGRKARVISRPCRNPNDFVRRLSTMSLPFRRWESCTDFRTKRGRGAPPSTGVRIPL